MGGIRWLHPPGLPRIGTDALRAPSNDLLAQQVFDAIRGRPRAVGSGIIGVEKIGLAVRAAVPVRTHDDPFPCVDLAVLGLPLLHAIGGQQKVFVLRALLRTIDHVDRRHQPLHIQRICITVGMILAGDPVVGRIEMGARMLPQLQPVPGKERAVVVIFADLVNLDLRCRLCKVGGQLQDRRIRPQNARAIDDLDPARSQHRAEIAH